MIEIDPIFLYLILTINGNLVKKFLIQYFHLPIPKDAVFFLREIQFY